MAVLAHSVAMMMVYTGHRQCQDMDMETSNTAAHPCFGRAGVMYAINHSFSFVRLSIRRSCSTQLFNLGFDRPTRRRAHAHDQHHAAGYARAYQGVV